MPWRKSTTWLWPLRLAQSAGVFERGPGRWGSAPRPRSARQASRWPKVAAARRGVTPAVEMASVGRLVWARSKSRLAVRPNWAALWSGDQSSAARASGSAPEFNKKRKASGDAASAAKWTAVRALEPRARSTSRPPSSSMVSQHWAEPERAAKWTAASPEASQARTSAPCCLAKRTRSSRRPSEAAARKATSTAVSNSATTSYLLFSAATQALSAARCGSESGASSSSKSATEPRASMREASRPAKAA
mmetsp:Transcript_23990/g.73909  ORF Transcript_23990/g.73909 Transcript_23990/m.73909 type:complete len:248 (-) Transcript_23990:376-1119(-)